MRNKLIFISLIGTLIAISFIIAAYVGFNLSALMEKTSVRDTFFEAELRSDDRSSSQESAAFFQLALLDNGYRVELVQEGQLTSESLGSDSQLDEPAQTPSIVRYHIFEQDRLMGQLDLETAYLQETDDYYYFIHYTSMHRSEQPLRFMATIHSNSKQVNYRYIHYPEHERKLEEGIMEAASPPNLQDGILTDSIPLKKKEELPAHSLYLAGEDFSLHLNRVNLYTPLGNGVRRAHDQLSPSFNYTRQERAHSFVVTLPHFEGMEMEHWGLVGTANMFGWGDEHQEDLYVVANSDRVRKWTRGGFQYITPTSYYPYDPNGFWVVPAQHVGNRLLLAGRDRFSTNMALLSLEAALATQLDEGMWVTEPRSEWLYGDYGIEAGFYDTRFSTDAGLFLIYGYREFADPRYLEGARKYGDFLVRFAETHHFTTENGGYLVWDYRDASWDGTTKKETHVSLNHLVTEMNFLYELYLELQTKNLQADTYLQIAEKMRTAVQDTREHWKKEENGDLWYAYMPDGSYGLLDYPLLTLKDLRYSQTLIEAIHGEQDADFQYLIEVKEAYLREQGLPLYD